MGLFQECSPHEQFPWGVGWGPCLKQGWVQGLARQKSCLFGRNTLSLFAFGFFPPLFFFWKLQASILNAATVKFREKISRFGM